MAAKRQLIPRAKTALVIACAAFTFSLGGVACNPTGDEEEDTSKNEECGILGDTSSPSAAEQEIRRGGLGRNEFFSTDTLPSLGSTDLQTEDNLHQQCSVCGKRFALQFELASHMTSHEKPFRCFRCDKSYKRRRNLVEHNSTVHQGVQRSKVKCSTCCREYSSAFALNHHMHTHTEERESFPCDVCGKVKVYLLKTSLKRHKVEHSGEKPFSCEVCGSTFSLYSSLKLHLRTHSEGKDFLCDICGKTFACSTLLVVHQRSHTGEKPYECDVCHKAFARVGDLNVHKRIHSGEKPYKCEVCHKAFSRAYNLSEHKRIHEAL